MSISILSGARASGKSTAMLNGLMMKAIGNEDVQVAYVATTASYARFSKNLILESVKHMGCLRSVTNHSIVLTNGSVIYVYAPEATRHLPYMAARLYSLGFDEPNEKTCLLIENLDKRFPNLNMMVTLAEELDGSDVQGAV